MPTIPDDTKVPHSIRVVGRLTAAGNPGVCNHRIYGMSCDDFDALEERSGGRCEICGILPDFPHVDHDHALGWNAVRGLLCPKCNAHMRRVDSGERPIEGATARYIAMPFWAARGVRPQPYVSEYNQAWERVSYPWKIRLQMAAEQNGHTLSAAIQAALQAYVFEHGKDADNERAAES